jgi:hypothetical protein
MESGYTTITAEAPIKDSLQDSITDLGERIEQTRASLDRLLSEFDDRTDRMIAMRQSFSAYKTQPK